MIVRTFDAELIKSIITDDDIYPLCSDDASPPASDYTPPDPNVVLFLLVVHEGVIRGMFILVPKNGVTLEVHTCIKKSFRGKGAVLAATQMLKWVFSNTKARKVVTSIPSYNKPARAFAKMAGMTDEGINRQSFMKGGVLYNQWFMGITKEEVCQ